MGFDQSAFIIAGTAIAIAGVGLYLWDTRASAMFSKEQPQSNYSGSPYDIYGNDGSWVTGGKRRSRKNRKNIKSKTKRR
jgi:hypothetical protein